MGTFREPYEEMDEEWVVLFEEARGIGLTVQQVRQFLMRALPERVMEGVALNPEAV